MEHHPHRPVRYTMRAKRSPTSEHRGHDRRSIHALRLRAEATPPHGKRRTSVVARWVIAVALIPVLFIVALGAYAINIIYHAERAANEIAQPSVATVVHAVATGAPDLRPTNTPGPSGTIVPLAPPTAASTPLPPPDFARKDPFTVMLLGVEDQRNGPDDLSRSDTIILAYVDPLAKHVNLLSIPRDLRVAQPEGHGFAKMADVFANGDVLKYKGVGGVAYVWDTLEQNFLIKIDYYVRVNFDGFVKIVDTVGGVTVDNPYPIKDDAYPTSDFQYTRVFFPAGLMHFGGAEALRYVRTRHDDDDYERNLRQQQVILSIREQAQRLNLLSHATGLLDTLGDTFRTDVPQDQWLGMARFGIDLPRNAIQQYTLTDLLGNQTIGGIFYATIDWSQARSRAREFSPKENQDFLGAQANNRLNKGAAVVVENGTTTAGIASNWSVALRQQGYANARFIDAPTGTKGKVPKSRILYFSPNDAQTAQSLATALGLPATSVDGAAERPSEAPSADILILLGDDARAP